MSSEAQLPDTTGLASQINEEHKQAEESAQKALSHALKCGELLCWAKERVPHGQWSQWLASNFEGSGRSAQRYMRLYQNRESIEAKTPRVADLSLKAAESMIKAETSGDPQSSESAENSAESAVVHVPPQFGDTMPVREAARVVREALSYKPMHWIGDGVTLWMLRHDAGPDGDWAKTCRERIGADPALVKYLLEEATTEIDQDKDNTLIRYMGADLSELDGQAESRTEVQKALIDKCPPAVSDVAAQLRDLEATGAFAQMGYESVFDYAEQNYDFDREIFELLMSA